MPFSLGECTHRVDYVCLGRLVWNALITAWPGEAGNRVGLRAQAPAGGPIGEIYERVLQRKANSLASLVVITFA